MRFNRKELIKSVQDEIDRRVNQAAERNAEIHATRTASLVSHVDRYQDHWNTFANTIKRRVRRGEPITRLDVPGELRGRYGSRGELPYWDKDDPTKAICNTDQLEALIKILEACPDEYVTSTAIEAMGVKLKDVIAS